MRRPCARIVIWKQAALNSAIVDDERICARASSPSSPDFARARANLEVLEYTFDARGRQLDVTVLDPGDDPHVSYANHYIANGRVVVPLSGTVHDAAALDLLAQVYDGRDIVGVPGEVLAYGGGGPHCITQQIPAGVQLP